MVLVLIARAFAILLAILDVGRIELFRGVAEGRR